MVVTLSLPEGQAGALQQAVGFPGRVALQCLQEAAGGLARQHQQVDMVGHDHVGEEIIIPQLMRSKMDRCLHQRGDRFLRKIQWTASCCVEVSVDPNEGGAGIGFVRWRKVAMGKAAVEVPG